MSRSSFKPTDLVRDHEHRMAFGKFAGSTVGEIIANKEAGYLLWCHDNVPNFELHADLYQECIDQGPQKIDWYNTPALTEDRQFAKDQFRERSRNRSGINEDK